MRHLPEAPAGVMDFIFVSLIVWGQQQGYRWFNLGMAPLAGLENRALASIGAARLRAAQPASRLP